MATETVLRNIQISLPIKKVLTRLGFRKHKTILQADKKVRIQNTIEEAFMTLEMSCVYRKYMIIKREGDHQIVLDNDIILQSEKLSDFLSGADEIFLFGVTAGSNITEARDCFQKQGHNFEAAICDAVGSVCADEAAAWCHSYLGKMTASKGRQLTKKRFSPGFGDFSLSHQRIFYHQLKLDNIGITLTDSFLMVPEKSVTAIVGIEKMLEVL